MDDKVLIIDGVDISDCIAEGGLKWQLNDTDSSKSGRTADGVMHRARVAAKVRLDITCMPLYASQARDVLNAIYPVFVTVQYMDPMYGFVTKTMYSNNRPAALRHVVGGMAMWEGITFPLIER